MTDDESLLALRKENEELRQRVARLEQENDEARRELSAQRADAATVDALFRALPDLYFRMNAEGKIVDYRARSGDDLYVPPEVFLGKRMQDLLPPDVAAHIDRAFADALRTGKVGLAEYSLAMGESQERYEARVVALDGNQFVALIRQTTESHRNREALQQRSVELETLLRKVRLFRALADNAPNAIAVTRAGGEPFYANDACRALFRVSDAKAGINVAEFVAGGEAAAELGRSHKVCGDIGLFRRTDGSLFQGHLTAFALHEGVNSEVSHEAYIIADMTAMLAVEEERRALAEKVIAAQSETLRALSTPLVPIARHVVAVPLIGEVNAERAERLLEVLLDGVAQRGASIVLLDVTGVPEVDHDAADAIMRAARAVSLLGAELVLTGVGPGVARTIIAIGADLKGIVTLGSLEQGIAYAMGRKKR